MHLPQCFLQAWQLMVLTDGLGERFLHAGQGGVHCRFHQRPHGLLMQTCGQRVDRYETTKMEQCRVIVVGLRGQDGQPPGQHYRGSA